jgi:hypothetical protein
MPFASKEKKSVFILLSHAKFLLAAHLLMMIMESWLVQ